MNHTPGPWWGRESETNARLMAASPEMWELLLDLYHDMDVQIPSKYLDRLTDIRTKIEEGGV